MDEEQIRALKREFDAIPVPDELEGQVRAAIRRGKRREESVKMKIWGRNTAFAAMAAAAVLMVCVNVSPTVAHAVERVPVLGAITKVITFRTYEDQRGSVSAHVEVPQVDGGGEELERSIQAYTDRVIAEYKRDTQTAMSEGTSESGHYDLNLNYTVATDNDTIFALRFDKELVMASGMQEVKIYDVDKKTGAILRLGDLFQPDSNYLDVLTQVIQAQMRQQMQEDENVTYWLDSEMPDWDFTRLSEDVAFYIDQTGQLVIVFNEGDVAPMYMGVTEFSIPTETVAEIALPDYLD